MVIDRIEHLAYLARLALPGAERTRQEKDFREVLAFVDAIEKVPVASKPLLATISGNAHVLRDDVVAVSTLADALLAVAPDKRGRLIRVPAVLS